MKLRIDPQTLRLRLAPADVAELSRSGRVEATLVFPPDGSRRLVYVLEVSPQIGAPGVVFEPDCLRVRIPEAAARELTDTPRIGIEERLPVAAGPALLLVVEKDLKPERGPRSQP